MSRSIRGRQQELFLFGAQPVCYCCRLPWTPLPGGQWQVNCDCAAVGECPTCHFCTEHCRCDRQRAQYHRCPVGACMVLVHPWLLMCGKHWSLVPARLQARLMFRYRRFRRMEPSDEGYTEALRAFRVTQMEAVRASESACSSATTG